MPDITTNTSNLVINDGATYSVWNAQGVIVDGSELINGNLYAYTNGGNATIKNFTVKGGTLLARRVGNVLDTITLSAGALNLQAGASALNLDILGGTVNADTIGWGGGYMSSVRVSGGTALIASGTVVYDGSVVGAAARVHISSGGVWSGGSATAGAAFVSSGGVWSGGLINGGEIDNLNPDGGGLVNDVTISNGYLFVRNGNVAANLTLLGVTGVGYVAIQNGGVASNVDLYNKPKFYTLSGTIDNLTVNAGAYWNGNQGASNTVINNLTVEGYSEIYGTTVVNGGTFAPGIGVYVYDGVTLNNVSQTAGNVILSSGAIWNNGEFAGGITYVSNGASISGGRINGGEMRLFDAAGNTLVNGATVENGTLIVRNGNVGANLTLQGGETYLQAGGVLNDVVFNDGKIYTIDGTVNNLTVGTGAFFTRNNNFKVSNTVINNFTVEGYAEVFGTTVVNGGSVTGRAYLFDGAIFRDVSVGNGARVYLSSGAIWSGGDINAAATAAAVAVSSGAVWSGGRITGAKGEIDVIDAAGNGWANDVSVENGYLFVYSATNSITNIAISGGSTIVNRGGVASNVDLYGNTARFLTYSGTVDNLTVHSGGYWNGNSGTSNTVINDLTVEGYAEIYGTTVINGGTFAPGVGVYLYDNVTLNSVSQTAGNVILSSGAVWNDGEFAGGITYVSNGASISGGKINGGEMRLFDAAGNTLVNGATVENGTLIVRNGNVGANLTLQGGETFLQADGVLSNVDIEQGGTLYAISGTIDALTVYSGGALTSNVNFKTSNTTINGLDVRMGGQAEIYGTTVVNNGVVAGNVYANNGATLNSIVQTGGEIDIGSGAVASNINATGGVVDVKNGGIVNMVAENTLNNAKTVTGATVNYARNKSAATIQGADTNIAASTFYYNGAANANGFSVVNGVVKNLGADDVAYRIGFGDGITVENAIVKDDWRISGFGSAVLNGVNIIGGPNDDTSIVLRDSSVVYNAVLNGGAKQAIVNVWDNAAASGTVVNSNGKLGIGAATAKIENTTITAGGQLVFSAGGVGADTGRLLTLDFTAGGSSLTINNLGYVSSDTRIVAKGLNIGTTYTIATTGSTDRYVCCDAEGLYDNKVKGGATYTNAFAGKTWNFSTGNSIAVTEFSIGAAKSTAGAITTADTALNTNDRAAKWDATTSYTDSVTLADSTLAGDAWLEIDGTNVTTALYGASGNYAHTVNIEAKSGEIRNLAAGAGNGGSVAGVKLTLDGADVTGAAYAGGFGNVTGKTETLISDGSFSKDFYAGALANYKTTGVQTTVGDIALTVAGGEFSGNIYGASAVKSSVAGAHAAGDVTLTITDGSTTKGAQACIFAGGYATGTAANTTVYTVDSVTATISGGSWGTAAGGRGVFGGIMASGVTAQAGDVNLTVSGDAAMGNVYGGGWAQKTGGKSIVGDVNINIEGGTIANVFGGGSHSSSGGSTATGDITITVSGGNITGSIYARGQLDGDTTGAASVIFTGAANFGCDVFGYSYVGGAASDATLSFNGYTGAFSGSVGGFNSVTFADSTAMTLATESGNVSNGKWVFDLTDRAEVLAGTSLLTWSGADFAGDSVKVSFADDAQAQGGWNIAAVAEAFSGTTFDVEIGGSEIVSGLAYKGQIASGDYAGWGFDLESGVLKFKQLA